MRRRAYLVTSRQLLAIAPPTIAVVTDSTDEAITWLKLLGVLRGGFSVR